MARLYTRDVIAAALGVHPVVVRFKLENYSVPHLGKASRSFGYSADQVSVLWVWNPNGPFFLQKSKKLTHKSGYDACRYQLDLAADALIHRGGRPGRAQQELDAKYLKGGS